MYHPKAALWLTYQGAPRTLTRAESAFRKHPPAKGEATRKGSQIQVSLPGNNQDHLS